MGFGAGVLRPRATSSLVAAATIVGAPPMSALLVLLLEAFVEICSGVMISHFVLVVVLPNMSVEIAGTSAGLQCCRNSYSSDHFLYRAYLALACTRT